MRKSSHRALAVALVLSVPALGGCGAPPPPSGSSTTAASGSNRPAGANLTVFAAASLTSTFTELGRAFEAAHPGTTIAFTFGGSSGLVTQLEQGAPGDVFASADEINMAKATRAGLAQGTPTVFATNTLTIVTAPGNPKKITGLAGLAEPGVSTVVCAPQVPCGAATQKVQRAASVTLHPVSEEQSVTDVLGKVTSGQADAGIVYVTDAEGAGAKVTAVSFPESAKAVNRYPIVALKESSDSALAGAFVSFITGSAARSVLSAAGFAAP